MINGKQKGSQFERDICKKLSLWISDNKRDDLFWRSAMSGGRASVKFKKKQKNLTQIGDISSIDPSSSFFIEKFVVECKYYKDLKLENLIYNSNKGGVVEFWESLSNITKMSNKIPFLIAKQNHKEIVIITTLELNKFLYENNYKNLELCIFPDRQIVIYNFTKFLQTVDSIIFKKKYF